jgi:hypothetical protein
MGAFIERLGGENMAAPKAERDNIWIAIEFVV